MTQGIARNICRECHVHFQRLWLEEGPVCGVTECAGC